MNCPCGTQKIYNSCCGLYIEQGQIPQTAEALMRSRYTAYAINNIYYVYETMRGTPRKGFSKIVVAENNSKLQWTNLQILNTTETSVEFNATYLEDGIDYTLHEKSLFKNKNDRWYYIGAIT